MLHRHDNGVYLLQMIQVRDCSSIRLFLNVLVSIISNGHIVLLSLDMNVITLAEPV